MEVRYRRNITFLETRKKVECSMNDSAYANVAEKVIPISSSSSTATTTTTIKINNNLETKSAGAIEYGDYSRVRHSPST